MSEVLTHLLSIRKCQEALKVTTVTDFTTGFAKQMDFREGGEKCLAVMRREGAWAASTEVHGHGFQATGQPVLWAGRPHRTAEHGRDLWRSHHPIPLPKQIHPEHQVMMVFFSLHLV